MSLMPIENGLVVSSLNETLFPLLKSSVELGFPLEVS